MSQDELPPPPSPKHTPPPAEDEAAKLRREEEVRRRDRRDFIVDGAVMGGVGAAALALPLGFAYIIHDAANRQRVTEKTVKGVRDREDLKPPLDPKVDAPTPPEEIEPPVVPTNTRPELTVPSPREVRIAVAPPPRERPMMTIERDGHVRMKVDDFLRELWKENNVVSLAESGHNIFSVSSTSNIVIESLTAANHRRGNKLLVLELRHNHQHHIDDYMRTGNMSHLDFLDGYYAPTRMRQALRHIYLQNREGGTRHHIDVLCMDERAAEGASRATVNPAWVRRIAAATAAKSYDNILVIGGSYHSRNLAEEGNRADHRIDDFDEMLERSLGRKVTDLHVGQYEGIGHVAGIFRGVNRELRCSRRIGEYFDDADYTISTVATEEFMDIRSTIQARMDKINSFPADVRRTLSTGTIEAMDQLHAIVDAVPEAQRPIWQEAQQAEIRMNMWQFPEAKQVLTELGRLLANENIQVRNVQTGGMQNARDMIPALISRAERFDAAFKEAERTSRYDMTHRGGGPGRA